MSVSTVTSGSSLDEPKSGRFLRGSSAAVRELLAALDGRAYVHVIEKEFFLVTRIVDLFLAEPSYAAGTRLTADRRPAALALHGPARTELLEAFVAMVRVKRLRSPDPAAVDRFFRARDALGVPGVLDGLDRGRVTDVLGRLIEGDPAIPPPLEPMLPALAETVLFWSGGRRQVLVVHDEQSALTAGRLRRLHQALADGAFSPFAGLVAVDSRDDPRVQVADLLAGVARREVVSPAAGPGSAGRRPGPPATPWRPAAR